jgi:GNAT superfamily N-acetyltransferase
MKRLVTTWFLEMHGRADLQPARPAPPAFNLVRAEIPCPQLNRFLYTAVGAQWQWYTRLTWDYSQWLAYLNRPDLETWVAYVSGTPAGYFELERQKTGAVQIQYFGLLPDFVGKGLGGALLTAAVERAWDMGADRVWVHTCDLDHPQALANYTARGFHLYDTVQDLEDVPDEPLQPWPGANADLLAASRPDPPPHDNHRQGEHRPRNGAR